MRYSLGRSRPLRKVPMTPLRKHAIRQQLKRLRSKKKIQKARRLAFGLGMDLSNMDLSNMDLSTDALSDIDPGLLDSGISMTEYGGNGGGGFDWGDSIFNPGSDFDDVDFTSIDFGDVTSTDFDFTDNQLDLLLDDPVGSSIFEDFDFELFPGSEEDPSFFEDIFDQGGEIFAELAPSLVSAGLKIGMNELLDKDEMKKKIAQVRPGLTPQQREAAAAAARAKAIASSKPKTPAWVLPVAIGGGVLFLSLIMVLALRK